MKKIEIKGNEEAFETAEKLVRHFEDTRRKPYKVQGQYWTVGVGHTIKERDRFKEYSKEKIERLLIRDLRKAFKSILIYYCHLPHLVLKQHQIAALLSFIFDLGSVIFSDSNLLKYLRMGEEEKVGDEFLLWNKCTVKDRLVVSNTLDRRRKSERVLFLEGRIDYFKNEDKDIGG